MKLFYNIHNENPELLRQWREWPSPVAIVFQNGGLAVRMQNMRPDKTVIGREWPDKDWAEIHHRFGMRPADWAVYLASLYPDPRIVLYSTNETTKPEIVAGTLEFIDQCDKMGRRACVLNAGPGNPEPEHWFDYLWPIVEAVSGTHHLLGLHEYFDRHSPRYGWPVPDSELEAYIANGGWGWLIGRYRILFNKCDERGLARPTVQIGEHGADSLDPRYHGWRSGTGMTEEQFANDLTWCDRHVYSPDPDVIGQTVFSFGNSGGWENFDVSNAGTVLGILDTYAKAPPPPGPIPDNGDDDMSEWKTDQVRATGAGNTNVRPWPTTDNRPTETIGTQWIAIEARQGPYTQADGYEWIELRGGVNGWVVESLIEFKSKADPEPTPDPEPPSDDVAAELLALRGEVATLRGEVVALNAWMAERIASDRRWFEAFRDILDANMATAVMVGEKIDEYIGPSPEAK